MIYSFDSFVRYSETDSRELLSYEALINYLQDCSSQQAEVLHIGRKEQKAIHRTWFILNWNIRISRMPQLGETIRISTWAYKWRGIYGYRNYLITDQDGRHLVEADSLWVLMDMEKGRPGRRDASLCDPYGLHPKLESIPEVDRKLPMPENAVAEEGFAVMRHNLDSNGHVNNGQYVQLAAEYLPENFVPGSLQVEYMRSAQLGDQIIPQVQRKGDGSVIVALCGSNGDTFSIVVFGPKDAGTLAGASAASHKGGLND